MDHPVHHDRQGRAGLTATCRVKRLGRFAPRGENPGVPSLVSVNVGLPREAAWAGIGRTSIDKRPVRRPVHVDIRRNLMAWGQPEPHFEVPTAAPVTARQMQTNTAVGSWATKDVPIQIHGWHCARAALPDEVAFDGEVRQHAIVEITPSSEEREYPRAGGRSRYPFY